RRARRHGGEWTDSLRLLDGGATPFPARMVAAGARHGQSQPLGAIAADPPLHDRRVTSAPRSPRCPHRRCTPGLDVPHLLRAPVPRGGQSRPARPATGPLLHFRAFFSAIRPTLAVA